MSGRPQGRVRQPRRERSQRSRGRDNSADSVSSTRSERERDSNRNSNGRNTRRRPERRDERSRKPDDRPTERDATRSGNTDKRDDKGKRGEKPPTRERGDGRDVPRDLNRDHGKTSNSLDRHGNAVNESRLSSITKRIIRETDRERRINAARQLEEYFSSAENIQVILKNQDSILISLEDVIYERNILADVKDHLVQCLALFGGMLGYDTKRLFQWICNKLDSVLSDDVKTLLLTALSKIIQNEGSQQCFREIVVNVMSLLENILENVDSPDLLYAVLSVIMSIATDYPQAFAGYFRDTVDILVGWHIDTSQQQSLTTHMSECLIQLHPYWASDIAFSLTLLGQFLEDMEAYAEELGMLANKQVPHEEVPSPYTSLPKLTALVRVLTTVVNGIGDFFSPAQTHAITIPYIEDIIQRVTQSVCLSGFNFYYEKLFIAGNDCLNSMCNWLQVYYAGCCDQTALFVMQQLQYCQEPTYPHLMSLLGLIDKVISKVGKSMPVTFIKTLLCPGSQFMKLRLLPDEAILCNMMKVHQGFLGIRDVQLMEATYNITVAELTEQFSQLKRVAEVCRETDSTTTETLTDNETKAGLAAPIMGDRRKTINQPITDDGIERKTSSQPMANGIIDATNQPMKSDCMVSKETVSEPVTCVMTSKVEQNEPITDGLVSMVTTDGPIANKKVAMDNTNKPFTESIDHAIKACQLQSIIIFDLCSLSETATEKSAIIGQWKLTPTLFELLTKHISASEWVVASCYPAVQYTILHALYTHCQRNTHFLSSVKDASINPDYKKKGNLSFVLGLLSKVLLSCSSSYDTRKLCLVWVMEILDLIFKSGPEITARVEKHFTFDVLENSLLPLTFDPCCYLTMEVCECMKILIELKLLSPNCLKRCLQDCTVRLMDANEDVRDSYLSLIQTLPADILTSFASRNLLQDRVKVQKTRSHNDFKQLMTSCEDVWWVRKNHIIKPPTGTFHSYNFQVIMAFIQHGVLPSKEMQKDWLVRLFHTCNRPNKYTESELTQFNTSQSTLWFWATWETAQFCILSKLRTCLGRAQETFQAIEGSLNQYAKEAKAADQDDQAKPSSSDDKKPAEEDDQSTAAFSKAYTRQLRTTLLLQFVENLEKLMYNAYDGCTVGMPSPPKSVRVFFRTNRSTCQEWLSRIRLPAIEVSLRCGSPAIAVWHGMQIIQEMKAAGKLKGPDFEQTVLLLCRALCEVKSPQAIAGVKAWCTKNTEHEMPWINGLIQKAKGWYENAAEEYKTSLNTSINEVTNQVRDGNSENRNGLSPVSVEFLINEVADCYTKLSDWSEVEKWQKEISNSRKKALKTEIKHAMKLNLDMNYIRALSKFEEGKFTETQNLLQLIPGNSLNVMTENVKKSSWSLHTQETQMTFNPLWDVRKIQMAAELCIVQAGVLYGASASLGSKNSTKDGKLIKAVKDCMHQSASLAAGALHVGCLDWPPLVVPRNILQVQQATIMEDVLDSFVKGEPVPSVLKGDGTFTSDPTRHNCAVLNQALRFTSHVTQLTGSLGKPKGSLTNELLTLQLETATLARKQENYSLAQRLLLKQLVKLGVIVQPETESNGQNNILGSLVRGLTSVSNVKPSSRLELLKAQRESAKLAYALGHTQDAVGVISGSILEYTKVNESDNVVRELNSRSLVTLSKWLMNDRKLLTSTTKTNSNVTPVVAKMSSLCDTEEEFLGYGQSTLISLQEEDKPKNMTLDDEMVWSGGGICSVGSGIDDVESVCGQLLHLSTMQTPDLGKAWYHLAAWCYRWGRKTVEHASSMGNVELLLEERDRALQSIPKGATDEEIDAILSGLGQAHSAVAHDEDIGDDDQFYDNGMDITRKLLLQACPSLHDADPSSLETLLSIWKGVRDRLFKHYHYAAKAYFMYLKIGSRCSTTETSRTNGHQKINKSSDDGNVTATLRVLRLLVKHAGELRSILEEGLAHTPTRPWKDIIPQLFSRLNHPEAYVRQSVSELLCRVASDAPHLIVYPAVVGLTGSMPQFLNKNTESEGLLPLLVANIQDKPPSQNDSKLVSMDTSDKPAKQDSESSLENCYRTIVDSLQSVNPKLVSELQQFIQELRRITLLWEELWLGSLIQTHQDVLRRQQQLDEEIKRVTSNTTLNEQQKMTLIREKHIAIMKPVVFALEQLQKITNHPPATPHEQWFHRTYSTLIENALQVLRNPDNPAHPKASWEPFKQLVQTLQARSQKKSAYSLVMSAISPVLSKMNSTSIYMPGQIHFSGEIVTISSISNEVNILPTKTKPKKLVFIGSDGQRHTYLFKGLEDLHLDERIMQFLSICNNMFTRADSHRCPLFYARHYSVTPLGPRSGLIQWVDGAVPLFALYKRWQQREAATTSLLKSTQGTNPTPQPPMKPSELFYSKMTPALKEKGIKDPKESDRKEWPLSVMRSVLEELVKETPSDLLARELWCSSTGSHEWWHITKTYARSTAVMSMIGYIIGLGDRHLDNMLIDFTTGEVVHIDYNVCFEKGKGLRVPEKVPFRMTPNLETALGVTGVEGMFRLSCEQVLKILRQGRETLLTLLEAFVYDPLVDWTSANDNAFASAFYGGGAAGMKDNKVNKKEMERGVTQSLFSSRVAEMKVNWTTNRDEILTAICTQEELVDKYTASVKHLKSMDVILEKLKDQQGTLQSAVNNTNHPLHSLQAKFDEHVKVKSNHDNILQSIKSKLGECINWHSQHKASMEMIHSTQFSLLIAEILKPLDTGVPCFAPAIKFLKGAGQGNTVSQCEQLETELGGLLHQRRALQRTCLDLIHTYATVTSQFPSNYVDHNRMYEWMCWLKEIIQDSSSKMCQDVLKKSEETVPHSDKTADNPLSVAAMNSLMSMEVKLQTNLTDQNSKFIKFCERRKQESVETGFLSKAVEDALANLNKYVSENHPSAATCLTAVIVKVLCSQCKRCLVMEDTAKVAGDRLSDLTSREGDWFLEELCSMSGNVTQLLSLLRGHPLAIEEQNSSFKEAINTSIKGIFAVHKVFTALQELMTNFRNIIVPEAIKSLTSGDPSVLLMIKSLSRLVHEEDVASLAKSIEKEIKDEHDLQGVDFTNINSKVSVLKQKFDVIQQSRNGIGKDSNEGMTAGQMLLAGFNGLFTKVESELESMDAALTPVNNGSGNKTCNVVQDAKNVKETNGHGNIHLCSKFFFLRRLIVMAAFFQDCRELVENMKETPRNSQLSASGETVTEDQTQYNWNADKCCSEDELALHIRQFIAQSVQKRILGLPSQAMGIVVHEHLKLLDNGLDGSDSTGVQSIEEICKKGIDMKLKKGVFLQKQYSQMSLLTNAYDVAWRKHDFARRLDHNIHLYKGVVQRAQLQLARFQWLYEDDLLHCPLRGNNMISPAKASIMNDMRKRVQSLVQLEPAVKAVEDKIINQQSGIEQRLKWAAGANPALNPVLKEFDKTVNDRKHMLQMEAKHSSDICSLSNALIHFEMLRTQSHEVATLDSTISALVTKCKKSSSEFEKSQLKLKAVSEITSLLNIKCPPDTPITLGWMKNVLESVNQEISSHKSRKTQATNAVTKKRESLKSHTNTLKTLIMTHQQLVSEVKALLTTIAKDEDGNDSSAAAKLFITSYNRLSDESTQMIKTTLTCCSGKAENSDSADDKAFDDGVEEVKSLISSITSLIHWVHDHLLALASPLMPEDSGTNGGKTPIAAPPPTFASALQKGNTTVTKEIPETSTSYCPPTNPAILHKDHGLQSPVGGGSPSTRPAAVASPRKSSTAFLARDPKTGKAVQQRNTYAISVWRKVKAKLDGRDADQAKRMSVTDQVDHVIREATSLDNLSLMYEGWTAWV